MSLQHWGKKTSILAVAVGVAVGSVLFTGCGAEEKNNVQAAPSAESSAPISDARNTPVVRAAKAVSPAVVGITNKAQARDWFNNKVLVEQGVGSGVIIDKSGYIVTNNHVVQGASEIVVSLSDGRSLDGKVLGTDPVTDLAVVKVEGDNLSSAEWGDSDQIMVGEPAIAIGNPLGMEFQGSVTAGVISALNRSIDIGERRFKLIQTDAAINPGNSGGALVNADGKVIGINSAKIAASGVEGIGLAIPSNIVRPIVESIIEKGKVVRPYLGVGVFDKQTAAQYGYQLNVKAGVYVANLTLNGPADKAGIKKGDIILKIDGTETNKVVEVRSCVAEHQAGDTVEVLLLRNGKEITVKVQLEEMPDDN
jgi:serine protease Do